MGFKPGSGSKDSKYPRLRGSLFLALALTTVGGALAALAGCATQPPSPSRVAVSSSQPLATEAGLRALEQGGNAFDAAIAVAGVLAVVEPYDASLGSSGFFLIDTETGRERFIDGGFAAPPDAPGPASADSAAAAAIPGEPAALVYLSRHYAERPLEADLSDAVRLARSGFLPGPRFRALARRRLAALRQQDQPLLPNGKLPPRGRRLQQEQLADTLSQLAQRKNDAFYHHQGGRMIAQQAEKLGAHWTAASLGAYRVADRMPLRMHFGANQLLAAPAPSRAGRSLAQMLALTHTSPVAAKADPVDRIHHLTEIMHLARHDSAQHPRLPPDQLLTPLHLNYLAARIDPHRALTLPPLKVHQPRAADFATSFAVVDARGNRVVASLSLHRPFGCGKVLPGTGILLNDALAGAAPSTHGAAHGHLATQLTPVMLRMPRLELMTGSGGESTSPYALFLGLERVLGGMPVARALAAPRYQPGLHSPDLLLEQGAANAGQRAQLKSLGYKLQTAAQPLGRLDWISQSPRGHHLRAGTDPRGRGQGLVESD